MGPPLEAPQQNWASTFGKTKDMAGVTTSLASIQGSQLMDMPSMPSPTSTKAPIKFTEHSRYCAICTSLGKTSPTEFVMASDWDGDKEEEDQVKGEDKDKANDQKVPQTNPRFFAVMTTTLKPPKPPITEYFGKVSSESLIMDAPKEEHKCNTSMTKQEHKVQNKDTLEDID